jgi:hypothetical protein
MDSSTTLLSDVRGAIRYSSPSKRQGMLSMPPGPKTAISPQYVSARKAFLNLISQHQAQAMLEADPTNRDGAVSVLVEEGRKYDKVLIAQFPDPTNKSTKPEVRYFIDRRDGVIYGAKSPLAPNLKWYFGNVRDASKWNWSGYHGVPLDEKEAGVRRVGGYKGQNEYNHFEPAAA